MLSLVKSIIVQWLVFSFLSPILRKYMWMYSGESVMTYATYSQMLGVCSVCVCVQETIYMYTEVYVHMYICKRRNNK